MYEEIANLIENHIDEIAQETAAEAIMRELVGYAALPVAQLTQYIVPSLAMFVRYLRNGDANDYRDYVRVRCEARIAQGITSDEVFSMTQIIGDKIKECVNREMPGDMHARERAGLDRRVEGIVSVAYSTIAATQAAHRVRVIGH